MNYNNPTKKQYDEMSLLVGELLAVQKNYKLFILRTAIQYLQSGEPEIAVFQCFLEESLPVKLNIEDFVKEYSLLNLDDENLIKDDKTISTLNEYEEEISIILNKMELLKQKYALQLKEESELEREKLKNEKEFKEHRDEITKLIIRGNLEEEKEKPQNPFNFWEWLNNLKKWLYLTFRFKKS